MSEKNFRPAVEVDYYDNNLQNVIKPLNESPWLPLYIKAAECLPAAENCPAILDLGCGTGRFARHLANLGYQQYLGIDFSANRVEEAKKYVPEFSFSVADVLATSKELVSKFEIFVMLELLEHIEDDCSLLKSLPSGSRVVMSVPNYLSKSHIRCFNSVNDFDLRYRSFLDFDNAAIHTIPNQKRPNKVIYLVACRRH